MIGYLGGIFVMFLCRRNTLESRAHNWKSNITLMASVGSEEERKTAKRNESATLSLFIYLFRSEVQTLLLPLPPPVSVNEQ